MIAIRRSAERGRGSTDWLDSRHTFSFGDYYDTRHMGFGVLRVINEDIVKPGAGFATHPHRNMEIITYVISGALQHRDSLGTGSIIRPGDVQRMSAGSGIEHSEFNASATEPVHLLQIWILPEAIGAQPSYEQKAFRFDGEQAAVLVASREGKSGSVGLHQDVDLHVVTLRKNQAHPHRATGDRKIWLQMVKGEIDLDGEARLKAGDGAAIKDKATLTMTGIEDARFLLFDLP